MSAKRMTANPVRPARYRPGKPVADEPSSDEEQSEEGQEQQQTQSTARAPPLIGSSNPSDTAKIANNLNKVVLNESRGQAAADEAATKEAERIRRLAEEEDFVTEESEEDDSSEEEPGSEEDSESEESSSEDEAPKKFLRPTFIKKGQRKDDTTTAETKSEDQLWADSEVRRKEKADTLIQEQLEKDAAARAAGKKDWDDDEAQDVNEVDDTDDVDPETERAAWKLRELKRIKRDREAIEEAEKEREEIERRRNLSKEEREAEDREFLEQQKEEREEKGKMGYMQKYFHRGAFFQDDAKAEGLDRRDIMGSRYQDDVSNRELLPQYMQIRDMTRLGRKGRTRYKDLQSEDTGKWGTYDDKRQRKAEDGVDDIFKPDGYKEDKGASGANATVVGERKRVPDGAPQGPRAGRAEARRDTHTPKTGDDRDEQRRRSPPSKRRSYSRSRSPPQRRQHSDSRSPPRHGERRTSHSWSRSRTPPRHRHHLDRYERKRSPSPYFNRGRENKRRRVEGT